MSLSYRDSKLQMSFLKETSCGCNEIKFRLQLTTFVKNISLFVWNARELRPEVISTIMYHQLVICNANALSIVAQQAGALQLLTSFQMFSMAESSS